MAIRVALGGISHETNTYCRGTTGLDEFRVWRGEEIVANARGVRSYVGGMIDAAGGLGATLIPVLDAAATPSGTIAASAYETLSSEMLEGIKAVLPIDAVALALHGAGVVEGIDDLEGHLCRAVREAVGPQVKIVVTLDLHGNVTQAMADAVDCMFGVHYYPHTDAYDRGREAIEILPRLLAGRVRPVTHVETVPILLPPSTTNLYPASAVNELCAEVERRPGFLDCTFYHGFPYTDIAHVGVHLVATADGSRELARAGAREVAGWVWAHREEFRPEAFTPERAIARAMEIEGGPVVINETADNPDGGAPGDATHLLRAMFAARLQNACLGYVYDPEVVAAAHRAGVGATIEVKLGGKHDHLHGAPLDLTGYVKTLSDGKFVLHGPMSRGARVDLGRMARLQAGGIDVLVSSVRGQTLDAEVFLLHGIDVNRYKVVALKSSQHFRAAFGPLAKEIITVDTPGLTTLRIETFPRQKSPRPIWPLDAEARYPSSSGH